MFVVGIEMLHGITQVTLPLRRARVHTHKHARTHSRCPLKIPEGACVFSPPFNLPLVPTIGYYWESGDSAYCNNYIGWDTITFKGNPVWVVSTFNGSTPKQAPVWLPWELNCTAKAARQRRPSPWLAPIGFHWWWDLEQMTLLARQKQSGEDLQDLQVP